MAVNPVPAGYSTVTPMLCIKGAGAAIDFYKKAFNATEIYRIPGPGGLIMHAEIKIGNSIVMLSDETPQGSNKSPATTGASTGSQMLYVDKVDDWYKQACDAGGTGSMPPMDMFWGDRMGMITDPYGHSWAIASHIEDVSPAQMQERMAAMAH
ncbi:MAG: VOC family protein [bacterium]